MLLALPIVIPLATAALLVLLRRYTRAAALLHVVGSIALVAACCAVLARTWDGSIHVLRVGDWPTSVGIVLVGDALSGGMLVVTSLVALAVSISASRGIDLQRRRFGFASYCQLMVVGVCGALLTGDLFNLYVWFEVMLVSSFVLLVLGGERRQLEGAITYVAINLIASVTLLVAIGILYGAAGTVNLADLATRVRHGMDHSVAHVVGVLFLVAFGIKAALFPLFFWLPASYHTPPSLVAALFAGLLTKVGVYALLRVFSLLFWSGFDTTYDVILIASVLTMLTGALGAVGQRDLRPKLCYLLIAHVGYMTMGFALRTESGVAGAAFYIWHHMLVMTGLFMVSGIVVGENPQVAEARNAWLSPRKWMVGGAFLLLAMSLAGLPPSSGFVGKLALVRAALEVERYGVAAVALFVELLTLYALVRAWYDILQRERRKGSRDRPNLRCLREPAFTWVELGPVLGLTIASFGMGMVAAPVFQLAERTAVQLSTPSRYIGAVLGE
ncbi:MAG: Na+/H+ antiporter subunit D [Planctomycetales bacterium]|nr:Na+/H+ antiporter subunit D [Planctomycetales bacterium]